MMPSHSSASQPQPWITIEGSDRWLFYTRLQELDFTCHCRSHQPLQVQITSVPEAIQLWSVAQSIQRSRLTLVDWLEACWRR
ncbi:MAG: hypothetical protein VKJ24_17545 [Synechococcales bacterium]|nr:hypothetical protein [Synechococcales bacterium]